MVKKCKFNRKMRCNEAVECEKCAVFKKTGQQMLAPPKPKPVKVLKRKGHTTKYYKVKK